MRKRHLNPYRGAGFKTDGLLNTDAFRSRPNTVVTDEFEAATVVDVILDEKHPDLKNKLVDVDFTPVGSDGSMPAITDVDLSFIGCAVVRPIETFKNATRKSLILAYPLDASLSQYPIINEVVSVVHYLGKWYYTTQINLSNRVNSNADPSIEFLVGDGFEGLIRDESDQTSPYKGIKSTTGSKGTEPRFKGFTGKYFKFNEKIRRLKRFEGDTIIEGRFGSTIRIGAYDGINNKGSGDVKNSDYVGGGGNPMMLLRNRQRPVNKIQTDIKGKPYETDINVGFESKFNSYMVEDINWDGSSIQMTTGQTISKWAPKFHFLKQWFEVGREEQAGFAPAGPQPATSFKFPTLKGDQIVINSSRIVFSARDEEMISFAKKRMMFVTDTEFSVDAHDQIVLTTNQKTVLNSPFIYLGEYNQTNEPAVLGESLIEWLYELGEWLKTHRHNYVHEHEHGHPGPGDPAAATATTGAPNVQIDAFDPIITQTPIDVHVEALTALISRLPEILSKRVFLTGGGYAAGQDGGAVEKLSKPADLTNVPGGYFVAKSGEFKGEQGPKRIDVT